MKLLAITTAILATLFIGTASAGEPALAEREARSGWVPVSGTGIHYFTSAIIHSQRPTENGYVQRSTDIIELRGDLVGSVLYHPRSVFDFVNGTLVNTGHQVFSGTILGSAPVLLHDDEFRFEVNLFAGETEGWVYLVDRIAGPRIRCQLRISGVGAEPGQDAEVAYTGRCRFSGGRRPRHNTPLELR
ncbi:MAG: hypothetical protein QNI99_05590 [Woeseiaceae bacterium]|nr:hypothetical protein [Woeseiaceae bacterium]